MKKALMILPLCGALTLGGCTGMSNMQQSTLSGGAIGAAAGAGITAIAGGNPIWGAIGGAALGALGGYVYEKHEQQKSTTTTTPQKTTN
jgi:hypothetical protein